MFSGTNRDPFPHPILYSEIANVCPSSKNIGWPIFCCNILYSLCCSILLQNSSTGDLVISGGPYELYAQHFLLGVACYEL